MATREAQCSDPLTAEGARRRAQVAELREGLAQLCSSGITQLTLDGEQVPLEQLPRGRFTPAQREILRLVVEQREISPKEAGLIVHAYRDPPCARCTQGRCGFASSDGSDALKRLAKRGLVCRGAAGIWRPAAPAQSRPHELDQLGGTAAAPPAIARSPRGSARCGPKGARVGDIVVAERSRWVVQDVDLERREAVCRLLAGSHAVRRFRARRIEAIERAAGARTSDGGKAIPA